MKTTIEKARASRRKWYQANKEKAVAKVLERKSELKEWLTEYRKNTCCETCGENDIACLDFHHTDPSLKEISIATTIKNGWSKERILDEISKCVVLCSNCHRKFHYYS
ncbi:hypothetical protein KGP36_03135 [Patescibacteria group bacterium]|nr:hypothetical protein [Patescibacteria group bacterium]